MDFRILGPLQIVVGDRPLRLDAPKPRALLAILLLHENELVTSERLIEELWGGHPPATSAKVLQTYVSQLRGVLGDGLLLTQAPGYELRLEPGQLDLHRFECLVAEARVAEAATAARKLREALALWRGPPLADFAYEPFAQTHIARLGELRLGILEQRIDADLTLGRHADLVGEVEALVAEHPLRERLRSQLILALYRSGRQAEALAAYREARRTLVEELGIEPGTELERLERQILRHDSELDVAPLAPEAAGVLPPTDEPLKMRKPVTALFAELSGWTGIVERLDPETVHRLVSRYYAEAARVVARHGGTVTELAGELVVGLFGVPVAYEDDPVRAIRAALELRAEFEALGDELRGDHGVEVGLRLSIETGEVVVDVDPRGARAPFVVGHAPDIAARLVRAADPGEILIGPYAHRLLADAVRAEPLASLDAGRRGLPADAWRLLDLRLGRPAFTSPFVGRVREVAMLRELLARAIAERSCLLCTVAGPPGIGKSRLAREFFEAGCGDATVAVGRCPSYGEGITFWPLREIVRDLAGSEPRAWIEAQLAGATGAAGIADRVAAAVGAGTNGAQPEETLWSFRKLFEALARERPLVLAIDDAHWAEETLLDLVEHLVAFSADAPILVLCLARPELFENRPEFAVPQPNRTVISLQPLSEEDARGLLERLERAEQLTGPARARAAEVAEGNPLFLEQIVAFEREGGSAAMPPSIQALLAARIDRLDPADRGVLERAAIAGRAFERAGVADLLSPGEQTKLDERLLALVRKDFIQPGRSTVGTEDAFSFRHILVRDAAYEGIAKEVRAKLHERYADWLEARGREDEIVGYHLEQASVYRAEVGTVSEEGSDLVVRAEERLGASGRAALRRGDIVGAVNLLSRATSLPSAASSIRVQLLPDLGEALCASGELARAGEVLAEVAEAAERAAFAGDVHTAWRARLQAAWLRLETDPNVEVAEVLSEANAAVLAFAELHDERALAHAWHLIAWAHMDYGRLSDLAEAVRRGREHARAAGDTMTDEDLTIWALLAGVTGPVPAEQVAAEAEAELTRARSGGRRRVEGTALLVLAICAAFAGSFDEGRRLLAEAAAIDEELGGRGSGFRYTPAGMIELLADDVEAAERELRAGYETLRERGDSWFLCGVAAELADVRWLQGHDDEALELSQLSEQMAGKDGLVAQMMWRGARAKVLARLGQAEEAEALAREAVSIIEGTDYVLYLADALVDLAEVLRLENRSAEAATVAEKAQLLYEQKGNVIAARKVQTMLDQLTAGVPT